MCNFPEQYRSPLKELGTAILNYNVKKIVSTYDSFTADAIEYGCPTKLLKKTTLDTEKSKVDNK